MQDDSITIVPSDERYVPELTVVLDAVARERRHLLFLEAPPVEQCLAFVRNLTNGRGVQMLALAGERVVGWCDVVRQPRAPRRHCGTLGMGLLREYRGRRIGTELAVRTIDAARAIDMSRIELDVFASNTAALALYQRLGFIVEGVKRGAARIDGREEDIVAMALGGAIAHQDDGSSLSTFQFRRATVADADALVQFWRASGASMGGTDEPPFVRRALVHPDVVMMLAVLDERIVGSLMGTFDGWRGNLYRLVVAPDCRRRGVARELVRRVEEVLQAAGARRTTVLVEAERSGAVAFWAAAGYPRDERIVRHAADVGRGA